MMEKCLQKFEFVGALCLEQGGEIDEICQGYFKDERKSFGFDKISAYFDVSNQK